LSEAAAASDADRFESNGGWLFYEKAAVYSGKCG